MEVALGSLVPPSSLIPRADCIPAPAVRMQGVDFFMKFVVLPAIVAVVLWPLVISIINSKDPPP